MGDIMNLTIDTKKDIEKVFKNNKRIRNGLLKGEPDPSVIAEVRNYGSSNFTFDEVIECYELGTMEYLYNLALKKVDYYRVYSEIIGNGSNPYSIDLEIETMFDSCEKSREELLKEDVDTIRKIGRYSEFGISPIKVIESYENDNTEELYKLALKKQLYNDIYYEYLGEKTPNNTGKGK